MRKVLLSILIVASGCAPAPPKEKPAVRVAVVANMVTTGLWQEMAKHFEADTGYKVKVTVTGNRQVLDEGFRKGEADFITMHGSDEASNLVADGYATGMTPWTRNELVILGPTNDPAGIRGLTDGAAALRKIAETRAAYVDFNDQGSRQIAGRLWKRAGVSPQGDWVIKDESEPKQIIAFAQTNHAHVIIGRVAVTRRSSEGMDVLVQGDPEMRRSFVVMVANAKRFPDANIAGSLALAEYLTSAKGQQHLRDFAAKQPDGVPLFYPVSEE
jgi:tungstate transport system substrate-binding protein